LLFLQQGLKLLSLPNWRHKMKRLLFFTPPVQRQKQRWLPALFSLALLALSACAPSPRYLLFFTEITVSPEPQIGQAATLHLEFISDYDQPLATMDIYLPKGIQLVQGELTWEGSLAANQPQTHDISICTEFQGNYHIGITGRLRTGQYAGFLEPRTVILDVSQTNAQVFTSENLADRIIPTSTFGPAVLPTALPQDWVSPCP
jgi:hypothetical protein